VSNRNATEKETNKQRNCLTVEEHARKITLSQMTLLFIPSQLVYDAAPILWWTMPGRKSPGVEEH